MHEVKRIEIGGFRRLACVEIEMRPVMAMIGANGVGKTSFMDALTLLSSSAKGSMKDHLNEMGGVSDVITRGRSSDVVLRTNMEVPNYEPVEYGLSVVPQGQGYSISRETLTQARAGYSVPFKHIESRSGSISYFDPDNNRLVSPNWEYDPFESMLSQLPKMFPQPDKLRKTLSAVTQYHVLDVSPRAPVKLPQQLRPALLPGENGEDLAPFLYNLRETNNERYEAIEDALKAAFPGFQSIGFPVIAAGMVSMTWKEKSFSTPLYMHQLSEGTLRFLWLVSLLQSPELTTITMVDEPEVSLHPEMLAILAELMREASSRTQIIVATHSDRLIRFLEPDEVVVMDVDHDGGATMRWADSMDLEEWLDEYGLDEVWRMGRLGGRM